MDIQFLWLGQSAKVVIYYVTNYIIKTKLKLKVHLAYTVLQTTLNKVGDFDLNVNDLATHVKHLLQKCVYTLISP
ncbi:hypothetical protein JVT61DRAFT_4283 [Boletus reticuloceps]|uniref:Uncharacterized protein n=1 Tax=Boletus reticuloceps TaxID=495285 RepID=A0A8I3A778_9AGAM|nr:hypothetical protein JVT61DRAFT_4283 [Boletus reticuloceps]